MAAIRQAEPQREPEPEPEPEEAEEETGESKPKEPGGFLFGPFLQNLSVHIYV
jgi:hypothetical protein